MKTGMLFYDGSTKKTFSQKVTDAVVHYKKKYGTLPDLCVVNPNDWKEDQSQVTIEDRTISVQPDHQVLKDCFFIGFEHSDELPVPVAPKDSEAVQAFVRHSNRVRR